MKSLTRYLKMHTKERMEFVNITPQVEAAVAETKIAEGLCLVNAKYQHNLTGEDNGDAHHKRQIMGREVVVAVTNGRLDFGPWEQIFYGEFDGRRDKRVLIKVIGE